MVAIEVPFYTAPDTDDPAELCQMGYLALIAGHGEPAEATVEVHGLEPRLRVKVLLADLERAVTVMREQLEAVA